MATTLEVLASGYGLLEGPRVDDQNRLYFQRCPQLRSLPAQKSKL
jgi:hypothetical protein